MLELLLDRFFALALHLEEGRTFPEPLTAKEEARCLAEMKNGSREAKDVLIERNLRLVAHIIKKYYSANVETEELISVGTVGLIKAVNSFDPEKKVRLSTYAARCIDNEILMFFRNKRKTALDISFDDPIEQDADGNPLSLIDLISQDDTILEEISLKKNIRLLRRFLEEIDDPREKTILTMRYGLDGRDPMTQSEIAEVLGISRSYVSRIETKSLKKLRKKFEN